MRADEKAPIFNISRPESMSADDQARLLHLVNELNREQKTSHPLDQDLEARIANYELAARMQLEAMRVLRYANDAVARAAAVADVKAQPDGIAIRPQCRRHVLPTRLMYALSYY